jgi:hypothetical protein
MQFNKKQFNDVAAALKTHDENADVAIKNAVGPTRHPIAVPHPRRLKRRRMPGE